MGRGGAATGESPSPRSEDSVSPLLRRLTDMAYDLGETILYIYFY